MRKIVRKIPFLLTLLRLILAPILVLSAYENVPRWILVIFVVTAFLSDIFDGIIARKLNVSTSALRRFDSVTDVCFYLAVVWSGWILDAEKLRIFIFPIAILVTLEILSHVVCLARFRQTAATHAYICKFWGINLFIAALALIGFSKTGIFAWSAIILGFAAYIDVLMILLLAKTPPVDIKSAYHAWQMGRS